MMRQLPGRPANVRQRRNVRTSDCGTICGTNISQTWLMSLIDEVVLVLPLNLQVPQLLVGRRTQRNSQSAADRATDFTPSPCLPIRRKAKSIEPKLKARHVAPFPANSLYSPPRTPQPQATHKPPAHHEKGVGGARQRSTRVQGTPPKNASCERERDKSTTAKVSVTVVVTGFKRDILKSLCKDNHKSEDEYRRS